jgi:DNA repair protein RadC
MLIVKCKLPSCSGHPTRRWEAARILGIEVLDHLVLGDEGRYFSFKERKLL